MSHKEKHAFWHARCPLCGVSFDFRNASWDHIEPPAKGGPEIDENLQLTCERCNTAKGSSAVVETLFTIVNTPPTEPTTITLRIPARRWARIERKAARQGVASKVVIYRVLKKAFH